MSPCSGITRLSRASLKTRTNSRCDDTSYALECLLHSLVGRYGSSRLCAETHIARVGGAHDQNRVEDINVRVHKLCSMTPP
mmetsp:Transcript_11438/g.19533  ORF Transcript_11438/g.19533 Transcript_11438/m.19533 type:complete len:81 (-) Transcript_11438:56-298(-)